MQKITLFLTVLLALPIFLGAATSEEVRRIEEGKRQKLRPSEAVLQRRQTPTLQEKPAIDQSLYDQLLDKEVVTVAEAREMVRLLNDQEIHTKQVDSAPLSRGLLGQMICQALDIKGGLTMRVFGPRKRYAHKELVYLGIMFPGSSREYLSGKELVVTIIQAIEYITQDAEDED